MDNPFLFDASSMKAPMGLLHPVKALILDMDGVLWRDDEPIGNLPHVFGLIRELGYKLTLATNNATKSAEQYLEKLAGFGVALEPWQIVNSPQAVARFLRREFPGGGGVYVIGEPGLSSTLTEHGFYPAERDVCAVVVGLDRTLTYEKLRKATLLIRDGVPFIGTNPDATLPVPEGQAPGAGAILAAVEKASGVAPFIVGKPGPEMYQLALERLEVTPAEAIGVGDRLETDILGAQAAGCRTALVLSGVSTAEQAAQWQPAPDWIAPDLTSFILQLELPGG